MGSFRRKKTPTSDLNNFFWETPFDGKEGNLRYYQTDCHSVCLGKIVSKRFEKHLEYKKNKHAMNKIWFHFFQKIKIVVGCSFSRKHCAYRVISAK